MGAAASAFALASGAIAGPGPRWRYLGYAIRADGGGCKVNIRDGSASGTVLDTVSLGSDESDSAFYGAEGREGEGITVTVGLYCELVQGNLPTGSLRAAPG